VDAPAFFEPTTVEEAVHLLGAHEDACCMAGGATLVAMMNAELVEPGALISLRAIDTLRGIERQPDGTVRIGAMTRHAETASFDAFTDGQSVLAEAAGKIANPVVRNMGTIGGSVSFADPAADYAPALRALDAEIVIAGPGGERRVPVAAFFLDWYATALGEDELVTAVLIPPAPQGSVALYDKLDRVAGDFAVASVAVMLAMKDGRATDVRIAVGGCGPAPVRLEDVEQTLIGTALEAEGVAAAGRAIADACDPVDDVRASAEYRRLVVPRMISRAITAARTMAVS